VSELALLGSLNNDKDEIRLDSLELEAGSFSSGKGVMLGVCVNTFLCSLKRKHVA
jgi:hypothetical protein